MDRIHQPYKQHRNKQYMLTLDSLSDGLPDPLLAKMLLWVRA